MMNCLRTPAGGLASEHLYNMTNIGLNIHSDMLCDISRQSKATTLVNIPKETRL